MNKEKTRIVSHTYKGHGKHGFTYEITFNKSLEDTVRMRAMCEGLDRYDKMRPLWAILHNLIAHPLLLTGSKWADKFHDWTATKI